MTEPIMLVAMLIVSVVIHENAHAMTALWLGDTTAKDAGRITLNPIKHLDLVGSVIIPVFLAFSAGMVFGYAKPVPISPALLRGKDRGFAIVALAGPASNVALAIVAARAMRVFDLSPQTGRFVGMFVLLNIFLTVFNLLPIPPLDGSRIIRAFLPPRGVQRLDQLEPYGFLVLLLLVVLLGEPFFRLMNIFVSALVRVLPL